MIVTLCYVAMSLALVMMVPLDKIDSGAPFAAAFAYHGWHWARYIVALGALATVHPRFGTPWVATLLSGVAAALIALFTDFAELLNMVSISTLFAFWIVALACMWNRYWHPTSMSLVSRVGLSVHLIVIIGVSILFSILYWTTDAWIGLVVCGAIFVAAGISLFVFYRRGKIPASYATPLFPFVPVLSVGLNTFLLASLDRDAYIRFGVWTAAVTAVWFFYGAPAAARHEKQTSLPLGSKDFGSDLDGKDVGGGNGTTAANKPIVGEVALASGGKDATAAAAAATTPVA